MTKKSTRKKRSSRQQSSPIFILIKKISTFFSILTIFSIFIVASIWVAGPYLFNLNNDRNILFSSSKIDGLESKIYFTYFLPSTQKIKVFPVQSEIVDVLGGYGDYQLKAVYPLLKMEKKNQSFQSAAMSWGAGLVVDEVFELNPQVRIESKKDLSKLLRRKIISDLAQPGRLIESLQLFFYTQSVPIELVNIEMDSVRLDELISSKDSMIYEDCPAAVVNTTSKPGLASKVSTILEKSGAVVVRITDQSSPYQLSTFVYEADNLICQALVDRTQALFPKQTVEIDSYQLRQEYRADLVIFIGEDLASEMN